jgi:hypothetical protein
MLVLHNIRFSSETQFGLPHPKRSSEENMDRFLISLVIWTSLAFGQGSHQTSSPRAAVPQDPGPIGTVAGNGWVKRTLDLKIAEPSGGTIKSWFILAPPRALCTINVDGTKRYSGRFGNLFMSRASIMSSATGNDGYTSRYFSVTNTGLENGYTAGHNAYFDIPFRDSVRITIVGDTSWAAFYNIFYEIGRRDHGRHNEFFAVTGDSLLADANVNDTLLVLKKVGRGAYWSMYFWMLSDSITGNNRAFEERDFYCVPDGRNVHLSTGTEDYCGYYYNWESAAGLGSRTSDFHGSPTFGQRKDKRYLDAFYRIHELDQIPFENEFVLYWESWPDWRNIPQSRYCHIGYCIIYYLERL